MFLLYCITSNRWDSFGQRNSHIIFDAFLILCLLRAIQTSRLTKICNGEWNQNVHCPGQIDKLLLPYMKIPITVEFENFRTPFLSILNEHYLGIRE